MTHAWISLIVFVLCYALFVILPERRSWTACLGGALLVATGVLGWKDALLTKISWNVMGLFFGTLILTVIYFLLMVPVGDRWPNTGLGFLICSIPFVAAISILYMHDRSPRSLIPVLIVAVAAPTLVWWLSTYVFALTLP